MNETPTDQDQLLDEAIDLAIRLQNDLDNPVAIKVIQTWRSRSPQHEQAWLRVSKVHGASGKVLIQKRRSERRENLGLTRRNFMIGGFMVLGGGAFVYSSGLGRRARADYMTGKGEIRRVDLPDGSVVTLGPESAIALNFQTEHRNINLLNGMGFFEVIRDTDLPFSVSSDSFRATALGTDFDVSNNAGILTVSVAKGVVETRAPSSAFATAERLEPGQWIIFDPSSQTIERGTSEVSQIASWRDKLIIAENETIATLVARVQRWLPGHIFMADPFIGSQRVSGIFDLNDPLSALEAVVHPAGGHVRQISSYMTVISPF